jgi:hypothetical protein
VRDGRERSRGASGDRRPCRRSPEDDAEQDGDVPLDERPCGGTRASVTVKSEADEAEVAARLERDLRLFEAFAETRD